MYISSPTPLNTEKAFNSLNKMLSSSHNSRSLLTQYSRTANLSYLHMPQRPWNVLFSDCTYLKEFISEHGLLLILFQRFSLIHSSSGLSWSQHWGIIFHHCVLTISVVALTTMYPRKHTFTYLFQPVLSPLKIWTISVLFTCVRPRRRTIAASRRLSVIYADSCTDLAPHQHGHGLRLLKQSGISYLKEWFY